MFYFDIFEGLRKTILLEWTTKLNEFAEKELIKTSEYLELLSFSKKMTEMIEVTLSKDQNSIVRNSSAPNNTYPIPVSEIFGSEENEDGKTTNSDVVEMF